MTLERQPSWCVLLSSALRSVPWADEEDAETSLESCGMDFSYCVMVESSDWLLLPLRKFELEELATILNLKSRESTESIDYAELGEALSLQACEMVGSPTGEDPGQPGWGKRSGTAWGVYGLGQANALQLKEEVRTRDGVTDVRVLDTRLTWPMVIDRWGAASVGEALRGGELGESMAAVLRSVEDWLDPTSRS